MFLDWNGSKPNRATITFATLASRAWPQRRGPGVILFLCLLVDLDKPPHYL